MGKIPVLAVSEHRDDFSSLAKVDAGWSWALDLASALESLRRAEFPIVLLDRDVANGDWPSAMRQLLAIRNRTCIILISSVSDEYLWNEVVQCGGFDVLPRPIRKEQAVSLLDFAHTHWKTTWPVGKG